MRVFRDMELVEQLGSGVPRILQFYGKECFHFSENYIRLSFPSSSFEKETVGETAKSILNLIVQNPNLTREELAKHVGISVRGVEYNIKKLKSLGYLSRQGSTKNGRWIVASDLLKFDN